ncbi:MAG: indolepyruvate oxidoreductase subunit beta [Syntrophales bacterium]|jgi:indolepyruvate ferredoxin oxidoreductase beta subunit|nr:indolepyruvate oxidoreductase subunit beta [Syntrophales bacterium]MDY0044159.1 indolepyruvate oxidoreductase subunit beta [Syntrophales bacterium]
MFKGTKNILMVGVGGQGIIRASDILSLVLMEAGYDVKKSEVHGMAQRGGCVSSDIRFGEKVYSPLSKIGDVDILVSFEKMETLRYLGYVKDNGIIIVSDEKVYPPSVALGDEKYPENIEAVMKTFFAEVKIVSAVKIAEYAGDRRMANTVMLGVLSSFIDVGVEEWKKILRNEFSNKLVERNINAFEAGRNS